jgi:AAA15 family ATPase/GTPase
MLKSLKIENFRGFESFELNQLGRVNLLVGENNSGKTSVLEAVQFLASRTNLDSLSQIMADRGETFRSEERKNAAVGRDRELDIKHLFYGHELLLDKYFRITSINDSFEEEEVNVSFLASEYKQADLFDSPDDFNVDFELILTWIFNGDTAKLVAPLSSDGGISSEYLRRNHPRSLKSSSIKIQSIKTQFVTSASVSISMMTELFNQVVLKPEEQDIIQALQNVDPMIERIASLGDRYTSVQRRGGFVIKRRDEVNPVPIGSMGDGIWRILGLALTAVGSKGGILLVDEIDTGLHFTAMLNMWKMIWKTAKDLNVQVFATTHSRDCWESLAEIAENENVQDSEIMVHRIERGKPSSVVFNPSQMIIASERGIEVR